MLHRRKMLLPALAFLISACLTVSVPGSDHLGSDRPARVNNQSATLEAATQAGDKAIREGDWARAETHFREAVSLAPTQGFWRIQLVLVLGQQKKWKAALAELEPLARHGALDWIVTLNRKVTDGGVAFVNTETFLDERQGIPRYVKALRQFAQVDAVSRDIKVKLETFAREHKLTLLYDISKFKDLPFERGRTTDLTGDFIAYYNQSEFVTDYYGTVYIYRGVDTINYGTIIVLNPEAILYLGGKEFLSLPEKTFIGFKMPVGQYLLQMSWKNLQRVLNVEANQTYYLRIEQVVYPNYYQMIVDVNEKGALEALRKSYALPEKKIKLKQFEVIRKNPG